MGRSSMQPPPEDKVMRIQVDHRSQVRQQHEGNVPRESPCPDNSSLAGSSPPACENTPAEGTPAERQVHTAPSVSVRRLGWSRATFIAWLSV